MSGISVEKVHTLQTFHRGMLASEINVINYRIVSKNILHLKNELGTVLVEKRLRWFCRADTCSTESAIRPC